MADTSSLTCDLPPERAQGRIASLLALTQRMLQFLLAAALLTMALFVYDQQPYLPGSDFGYFLGLIGGSMMLALLIYPLRKRIPLLRHLGLLRHWFRFHLVAGSLGPLLVLFHSTFHVGSFNAGIALASMLLVAVSGLVGRFFYRHIHHGLYGSRATLAELKEQLASELESLTPLLRELPAIKQEMADFIALSTRAPCGRLAKILHFAAMGWRRWRCEYRVALSLRRKKSLISSQGVPEAQIEQLLATIRHTLRAAQKAAQFTTYEYLFSLWHTVHIPFLCLLVITAIVHVFAVHAY